jgi:RNA polymerase sigma factor (sigma-70 family)
VITPHSLLADPTSAVPGHVSPRVVPLDSPADTAVSVHSPATGGCSTCQTATGLPSDALNIAEIADRYAGLLHGVGRRYRLTPEEQEDAAQSTWLALCKSADQIRDPQRIPGWLATTMGRFSAAAVRRRHRESPASDWIDTFATADPAPEVADAVATKHATLRLHQAVAQLPERERRLIQLQFGPTEPGYKQISHAMQMPIGSIGPVRGRALSRLRTLLNDLE